MSRKKMVKKREAFAAKPLAELVLPSLSEGLHLSHFVLGAGSEAQRGLCIAATWKTRLRKIFDMVSKAFLLSLLLAAALYLPDFVFDYAHRGSDFIDFFGKFLGLGLGLMLLAAFGVTLFAEDQLFLDFEARRFVLTRRLRGKTFQRESLPFSLFRALEIETRPRLWGYASLFYAAPRFGYAPQRKLILDSCNARELMDVKQYLENLAQAPKPPREGDGGRDENESLS